LSPIAAYSFQTQHTSLKSRITSQKIEISKHNTNPPNNPFELSKPIWRDFNRTKTKKSPRENEAKNYKYKRSSDFRNAAYFLQTRHIPFKRRIFPPNTA
ncbi:hypothetical protein, partial [Sporosarcina sp. OR05]|uniref:hypothetical protein n=1 Tax=Sporosarcina sp. OR05 TaxID=2969819 RepID=UPI00352B57E4